jgi:hypothetical protein
LGKTKLIRANFGVTSPWVLCSCFIN